MKYFLGTAFRVRRGFSLAIYEHNIYIIYIFFSKWSEQIYLFLRRFGLMLSRFMFPIIIQK
jgi:hypothetical protein